MRRVLCFDVGGTYIKYGIVREDGEIIIKDKIESPKKNCKEAIPEIVINTYEKLKDSYQIDLIGISTAGHVDPVLGEIIFASDNLPSYTGCKLKNIIENTIGIKTYVENDVNAAALGELWMGAGKDIKNFLCLTLGTGVGAAIVINGEIYRGVNNASAWVGHSIMKKDGRDCTCGMKGCYERYASTSALIRSYAERSSTDISTINGEEIMNLVKAKDPLALQVYNEFIEYLVLGLVNLAYILDPGTILIGGGISSAGEYFFNNIREKFAELINPTLRNNTIICEALLKNDAGIFGACHLALNKG